MERAYDRSSNERSGARLAAEHPRPVGAQRVPGRVQPSGQPVELGVRRARGHRDRRFQQRRRRRVERWIERGRSRWPTTSTSTSAGTPCGPACCSRAARIINRDARNAAGTFTFSSLEAFLAGTPNTFTQRLGQLRTAFSQYQLGVYWQDDFRLNRSLSVSVGVREELQTHVGDAMNVMPRLGFTFTPQRARTTIRGGYGIFHDWYEANLYDQTLRVTGEAGAQRDLLILNPGYPDPAGGVDGDGPRRRARAGRSRISTMPYVHQASIGVERPLTQTLDAAGVVHVHARAQPAALSQRERARCVRRSSRT